MHCCLRLYVFGTGINIIPLLPFWGVGGWEGGDLSQCYKGKSLQINCCCSLLCSTIVHLRADSLCWIMLNVFIVLASCWFLYCALYSLDSEFSGSSMVGLYFCCKVWAFTIFLEACVEIIFLIIFTENKMKQKRTDGESAKAVREQVFLSRYKSEPGIVESSVSTSSAYCQYCCSFHRSVAENWKYSRKVRVYS